VEDKCNRKKPLKQTDNISTNDYLGINAYLKIEKIPMKRINNG
jgi:hypothetical protein